MIILNFIYHIIQKKSFDIMSEEDTKKLYDNCSKHYLTLSKEQKDSLHQYQGTYFSTIP